MTPLETLRAALPALPPTDRLAVVSRIVDTFVAPPMVAPLIVAPPIVAPPSGAPRTGAPSIAAALERALWSRTGRDFEVDEIEPHQQALTVTTYDAVVIALPVSTPALTAVLSGWQHAVQTALGAVLADIPPHTPVLVAVPVARSAWAEHTLRARLADRRLNRFTSDVSSILTRLGRGELIAVPIVVDRSADMRGAREVTDRLAGAVADRLAPRLLQAAHDAVARGLKLPA